MKRSIVIHKIAAFAVFLVWIALIGAMIMNWDFWSSGFAAVLLCSIATMVGTVLHSRYRIRHNAKPSFGSILTVPCVCAFLLCLGSLFCYACYYDEWDVFTLSYWNQTKGGFSDLILSFLVFWFVCLFPAAAIVIYFQKPNNLAQVG